MVLVLVQSNIAIESKTIQFVLDMLRGIGVTQVQSA